ncbi:MAG: glycosyltransferase family 2 protein [Prevotellaceae bacterium]|jgi:glycosyltransferase involved in cell wall biosynthesis|nr:glycosyltransferase family 2 protein [Prevotellaceae bacterium]
MQNTPKISILMPCFNVEKYVAEAIESMLNQTFGNFELLILDDCSTDRTAEIVKSFADKRIVYHKNETNLGLSENLNVGIRLAKGEYIARMDGDDISVPERLEKQAAVLEKHPEIDICGAGFKWFGTRTSTVFHPKNHEEIKAQMLFGCPVIIPIFRKNVIIENNLWYRTSAFPAEDYMFWAECVRVAKIYNIQEILFYYRMHESQISTEKHAIQIQKSNEVKLFVLNYLNPNFTEKEKRYFLEQFACSKIENKADLTQFKQFAKLLEQKNNELKNFNAKVLHKKLRNHIKGAMYAFSLKKYFENGYNLKHFFLYLLSGNIFYIHFKLNIKILAKSTLNKK